MSVWSTLGNVFEAVESIINPVWHSAKKEMDQAVESVLAVTQNKDEIKAALEDMGYQTGSIIEDVGKAFKSVFSYIKWLLVAALAIFLAWAFFGRKT